MTTHTDTRWVDRYAHPVRADNPQGTLTDLAPLRHWAHEATVVALGVSSRDTHELSVLAHRMLRLLVEELGFRALALEGDDVASIAIDDYVRTGTGDPHAILAGARPFLATRELLDAVTWIRGHNMQQPDDPIRIVHDTDTSHHTPTQPTDLDMIEKMMSDNVIRWHERTGDKIAYWGGIAHTANADSRTTTVSGRTVTHRSAGSYLRSRFGPRYLSIGLMFDHGTGVHTYPEPPPEFAEAALGATAIDTYLLDLRPQHPTWLDLPAKTRLIGPVYDPADDAAYHLAGGSLTEWFDVLGHQQEVTPTRPLPSRT